MLQTEYLAKEEMVTIKKLDTDNILREAAKGQHLVFIWGNKLSLSQRIFVCCRTEHQEGPFGRESDT